MGGGPGEAREKRRRAWKGPAPALILTKAYKEPLRVAAGPERRPQEQEPPRSTPFSPIPSPPRLSLPSLLWHVGDCDAQHWRPAPHPAIFRRSRLQCEKVGAHKCFCGTSALSPQGHF